MPKQPLDYAAPPLPPERLSGPGRWLIIFLIATVIAIAVLVVFAMHMVYRF